MTELFKENEDNRARESSRSGNALDTEAESSGGDDAPVAEEVQKATAPDGFAITLAEDNVTRLEYQGKEIVLVSTAHVSKQSVELVKHVVSLERPDSICVELDEDRVKQLENPDEWKNTDITKVIRANKVGFLLASLILSSYQKKMAEKLNTNVGQEMVQGMVCAREIGAELVLADRKIQTTFLRIWRKLGFAEKCKLLFNIIFNLDEDGEEISEDALQQLLQDDMLEAAMGDVHQRFPKVGEILIDERDQYLANKIKNAPGKKIVAVLGGAHVPGIKSEIFKEQNMEEISSVPAASPLTKIIGWAVPLLIVGLIAYGFTQGVSVGLTQLKTWLLTTSLLAALFTALSLGHPLTILTSLLASPITVLHPFLACGWFAGLVEAYIRKPTVKDLEEIPDVILSVKGFFKNRFLRIILIVMMANIGASIGTFVAAGGLIKNIFGMS
ncbi:MAG: TraB/GumN family protein [Clostridiales Family XIII bacterium]|jgi:pheromone shutdown-related protein TraB|nr:TraB/GumN family protein [Clostridiales Family XIII bacterium]